MYALQIIRSVLFMVIVTTFSVFTSSAQSLRLNEVSPQGDWVELYNQSDAAIDISEYWLCSQRICRRIDNGAGPGPDISIFNGTTSVQSDGYLVLSWPLNSDGSDVALYDSDKFESIASLQDFMQYDFTGIGGYENVAVDKGIWTAGTSAPPTPPGKTLSNFGPGIGVGAWAVGESTRGLNNASLPVELAEFSGRLAHETIELFWSTRSEINNLGFEVQVMPPANAAFQTIGFVGAGSEGSGIQNYGFIVDNLVSGTYFFRLRQLDVGGTIKYSSVVEVVVPVTGTHELTAAFPNPFSETTRFNLTVSREQRVLVTLFDISGRLVYTVFDGVISGDETRQFQISRTTLTSGTYFYRVIGENFTATKSVVVVSS